MRNFLVMSAVVAAVFGAASASEGHPDVHLNRTTLPGLLHGAKEGLHGSLLADGTAPKRPEVWLADGTAPKRPEVWLADDTAPKRPGVALADGTAPKRPGIALADGTAPKRPGIALADGAAPKRPDAWLTPDPQLADRPRVARDLSLI